MKITLYHNRNPNDRPGLLHENIQKIFSAISSLLYFTKVELIKCSEDTSFDGFQSELIVLEGFRNAITPILDMSPEILHQTIRKFISSNIKGVTVFEISEPEIYEKKQITLENGEEWLEYILKEPREGKSTPYCRIFEPLVEQNGVLKIAGPTRCEYPPYRTSTITAPAPGQTFSKSQSSSSSSQSNSSSTTSTTAVTTTATLTAANNVGFFPLQNSKKIKEQLQKIAGKNWKFSKQENTWWLRGNPKTMKDIYQHLEKEIGFEKNQSEKYISLREVVESEDKVILVKRVSDLSLESIRPFPVQQPTQPLKTVDFLLGV